MTKPVHYLSDYTGKAYAQSQLTAKYPGNEGVSVVAILVRDVTEAQLVEFGLSSASSDIYRP